MAKPKSHLKLGTRRSLLARAQSAWVARELERRNPGVTVELVGIDTRGDRIQDVPLQAVEGKEFFVAEIDEALRSGAVDLTVHSMKDLSLERPREFTCAAIPRRENSRDCVLFAPGVLPKLRAGQPLRVGTSSPRRLENIPAFLAEALPRVGPSGVPACEFIEIRGNVNTRLARLHEDKPAGASGAGARLDAVVLAFAGLIRLWNDEQGRRELKRLLEGARWMVLPLRECPSAPAQGALAVECRSADQDVRAIVGKLHDEASARLVSSERKLLADWGGGCHQKFGASAVAHPELGQELGQNIGQKVGQCFGTILYVRGKKPDGSFVEETRWGEPPRERVNGAWDGAQWRRSCAHAVRGTSARVPGMSGSSVFVAHERAVQAIEWVEAVSGARVWVSGVASWKALAARGIWVEGCAESAGFASLESTLAEGVLGLPPLARWTVLSHEGAAGDWGGSRFVGTYSADPESYSDEALSALATSSHVYWSSGSQFDALKAKARPDARHACGPGKTAARLRRAGAKPAVFPSVEEWRKWVKR